MKNGNACFAVDGTSALEVSYDCSSFSHKGFELEVVRGKACGKSKSPLHAAQKVNLQSWFKDVLDASEMYCSLRFEDYRGCPYGIFTKRGIATLSAGSAVVAVLSIAFGA